MYRYSSRQDDKMDDILKSRVIEEKDYRDKLILDREPYLRDRDRILFSRAFRRLAFKTQVVTASGRITSDHIRSRLTHSLEVMQIASSIALRVNEKLGEAREKSKKLDINLVQAIALGHDIGHTPYGHVGEEAIFDFIFREDPKYGDLLKKKLRHCFQSLKVCCFLEKHYRPDFYGLNLTIATLDGIFKHSNLSKDEMHVYKDLFECYCEEFWYEEGVEVQEDNLDSLKKYLFGYTSPVTLEGIVVSIADEIAQLCHDIEDFRRIGGFEYVRDEFYKNAIDEIKKYYTCLKEVEKETMSDKKFSDKISEVYSDLKEIWDKIEKGEEFLLKKLERLYVKLILQISILSVSEVILVLSEMDENSRLRLVKKHYFGKFGNLIKLSKRELELGENMVETFGVLNKLFKRCNKNTLLTIPEIARWDIKGREICMELSEMLLKAFKHNSGGEGSEINLNILHKELRDSVKKSYYVGKRIGRILNREDENLPIKIAVWDYLAGMTDYFIIREYESLTFKKVELK